MSLATVLARTPGTVGLIAIGGSAGAIETLARLFAGLPADYAAPLAVVVHLPRRHPSALAAALQTSCPLPIVEAQDKEPLRPGRVHVAPPDYHMLVDEGATLALSVEEPVHYSVPAIDVLFESAAAAFGPRVAAVVLSGANRDGADGLAAVARAGGLALVHDPRECVASQMPTAALERTPEAVVLPLTNLRRVLAGLGTPAAACT